MASTDPSTALAELLKSFEANKTDTYLYVSALAFLVYDITISFGEEVNYMWKSRWSTVKVLYFLARYYSLINLIAIVGIFTSVNLSILRYFTWTLICGPSMFIVVLDLILLLRVNSLYNDNKKLFFFLLAFVLGNFGAALWAGTKLGLSLSAGVFSIPAPWQGCTAQVPAAKYVLSVYVPNYVLSLIFLSLTLWKLVETHQIVHGKLTFHSLRTMNTVSPLLVAFVRDGSIFFALASVATFLSLTASFFVQGPLQAMFFPWTMAVYSYSGAHLIVNLRASATKGTVSLSLPAMSQGGNANQEPLQFVHTSSDTSA